MTEASEFLRSWAQRQGLSGRDQANKAAELLGITPAYWRMLTASSPREPKKTLMVAVTQWLRADDLSEENAALRAQVDTLNDTIARMVKST